MFCSFQTEAKSCQRNCVVRLFFSDSQIHSNYSPPPRMFCFHSRPFVCCFVCLHIRIKLQDGFPQDLAEGWVPIQSWCNQGHFQHSQCFSRLCGAAWLDLRELLGLGRGICILSKIYLSLSLKLWDVFEHFGWFLREWFMDLGDIYECVFFLQMQIKMLKWNQRWFHQETLGPWWKCVCVLGTLLVKGCGACPDGFRPSRFRSGT